MSTLRPLVQSAGQFAEAGAATGVRIEGGVAIGSAVAPGQAIHVGDGNILLEGGGETAMLFKRGVSYTSATHPSAPFVNPIFQIGRIIQGGDGAPQFRWMYADDSHPEVVVFELDSEGILSSVRQAGASARGSHFEAHYTGAAHPYFRLNSWPHMRLQMGNGGMDDTDVSIGRVAPNTVGLDLTNIFRIPALANAAAIGADASGNLIPVAGASPLKGVATLDFGSTPRSYTSVAVPLASASYTDCVHVNLSGSTASHSATEHAIEAMDLGVEVVPGTGFIVHAQMRAGLSSGTWSVTWSVT